jgi:phosphate transport system substrate-binding protein
MLAAACGGGEGGPVTPKTSSGSTDAGTVLNGAGATFPAPLYTKWIADYNKQHPDVKIDYQGIGSGGGIKQITEQTVDFGASDAPMTDEQIAALGGKEILHIPTVLGAVVVTYNIPDLAKPLELDGPTVADIFLGNVKTWNDPKIAAQNPGATLPATEIAPVSRADGSGTTAIFTDYLAKVSPAWKSGPGQGTSVKWPGGTSQKGNDGVAGFVKQTPGAVGYVELIYAKNNNLPYAWMKNAAGAYVEPSLDSVTAAAAGVASTMPADLRVSVTNAEGANAYPIAGFTYLLVYKDQTDQAKGQALADFVWWALHNGSETARSLVYAPLPAEVLTKAEGRAKMINHNGTPLVKG